MRALFLPHPLAFDAEPPTFCGVAQLVGGALPEVLTVRFQPIGQRERGPALATYAEAWEYAGEWIISVLGRSGTRGDDVELAAETVPAYRFLGERLA